MSMSMSSVKASDPGSAWFGAGKYRGPAGAAGGGGPTRNVRLVAASVAAFVSVLGLALLLHLYICRVRRRNRRRAESAARQVAAKAPGKAGLEPSAIAALPTAAYEAEEAGSECAICLGAMEKGDAVRVLPACAHDVFHVACVDTWLASSSSCPVCRASVEPPPPAPTLAGWVQEKPDLEKQDAAGSSARLGASLMKMLGRERPLPRRPAQVQQGDQAHAVEMDQFDLESQQQQHAVNN